MLLDGQMGKDATILNNLRALLVRNLLVVGHWLFSCWQPFRFPRVPLTYLGDDFLNASVNWKC